MIKTKVGGGCLQPERHAKIRGNKGRSLWWAAVLQPMSQEGETNKPRAPQQSGTLENEMRKWKSVPRSKAFSWETVCNVPDDTCALIFQMSGKVRSVLKLLKLNVEVTPPKITAV